MKNSIFIFYAISYVLERFEISDEFFEGEVCKTDIEVYKSEKKLNYIEICKEVENLFVNNEPDIVCVIDKKMSKDALMEFKEKISYLKKKYSKKEISLLAFENLFYDIISQYGKKMFLTYKNQIKQRITFFDYMKAFVVVFLLKVKCIEKGSEDCFLYNIDISDHKQFYFDGMRTGDLAGVRFRWNYYELIRFFASKEFLRLFDLNGFFGIYSGGKHTYIVSPQYESEKVDEFIKKYKKWMIEQFGIDLYLSLSVEKFSLNEVLNHSEKCIEIFSSVTTKNIQSEYQRYTSAEIEKLNGRFFSKDISDEFIFDNMADESVFVISKSDKGLSVFPGYVLSAISQNMFFSKQLNLKYDNYLMPKFDAFTDDVHKYIRFRFRKSRYNSIIFMEENGQVGVARFDIDNSRKLLTNPNVLQVHKNNVLNLISFSDELDDFMKNRVVEYISSYSEKRQLDLLYLGADDFSVIGKKKDILDFSIQFCKDMFDFTDGKVSFSVGACVCSASIMLETMINKADELLWKAKREEGKSTIMYENEYGIEEIIRWKEM